MILKSFTVKYFNDFDLCSKKSYKYRLTGFFYHFWFTYLCKGYSEKAAALKMVEYLSIVLITLQIVQAVKELREMFKRK